MCRAKVSESKRDVMSKSLVFWRLGWLSWLGWFAFLERRALKSAVNYAPLTWHLRYVLGIEKHKAHRFVGKVAFFYFFGWMWRHLYKVVRDAEICS